MRVQPARNRQTDSQNKTELRAQSARRAGSAGQTNRHKSVCVKAAEKRHAGREQSSGTPAEKGRAFRGLRMKKQQKNLCLLRTADKRQQAPGAAQARHKSGRRRVGRKTTPQKADTIAASLPPGRQVQQGTHAGTPITQAGAKAAGRARTASLLYGAARRTKNPSEQAKFAFALLPARRGHVNRGRQKIASLFLAGTVFLAAHCALRRARRCTKGGAAPFYPLQAF